MFRLPFSDILSPVLRSSPALAVSPEQIRLIEKILDVHCSDKKSSQKALIGLTYVLTAGNTIIPVITSVNPPTLLSGQSATLTVNGSGFIAGQSRIVINGNDVDTTFISGNQLTAFVVAPQTTVNRQYPVMVQNPLVMSNAVNVTVNAS